MNPKIKFLKRKLALRREGKPKEEINRILTEEGLILTENGDKEEAKENFPVKKPEIKEIDSNFNDNNVKVVWCHQCRDKVPIEDYNIEERDGAKGYRSFLTGKCSRCGRKVSGIVKNQP